MGLWTMATTPFSRARWDGIRKQLYLNTGPVCLHSTLYFIVLDLKKTFDRVPRKLFWYALQQHLVPKEPVHADVFLASHNKTNVERPIILRSTISGRL